MNLFLSILLSLLPVQDRAPREFLEDFEEPPSPDAICPGWERVRSPAHPAWNRIERVRGGAPSGEYFLRMTSMGGSTALQMMKENAWPIDPARSYRLSALVRIDVARRNIATVTVIWLDKQRAVVGEVPSLPAS